MMVEIKQMLRVISLVVLASAAIFAAAQGRATGEMVSEEAIEAAFIEIIAEGSSLSAVSVRSCDACPRRIFKSSDALEVKVGDELLTKTSGLEGRAGPGAVFYDPETETVTRIIFLE